MRKYYSKKCWLLIIIFIINFIYSIAIFQIETINNSRNQDNMSLNLESSYLDESYKTYWKNNGTVMSNDMRGYHFPIITDDGNGGAILGAIIGLL